MESAWLGTGPRVAQFERDFATYQGLPPSQVAAVNSCTAALHVSMVAADLEPGAEVITTPMTFCASVNAIIHAGLSPVLADVDPATQCIDPAAIEAAITPRTRAILPVHFAGRPCEMDAIMAIARKHALRVQQQADDAWCGAIPHPVIVFRRCTSPPASFDRRRTSMSSTTASLGFRHTK
jgi:dTDP-4-amino-4,6-dideoxygalactose transaminase